MLTNDYHLIKAAIVSLIGDYKLNFVKQLILLTMEMNYLIVAVVLLLVVILIVWIIRRNQKDKKKFEKEIINSELKPESHKEDKV